MKKIILKPVNVSTRIFQFLERRNLIRTLKPTQRIIQTRSQRGCVDTIYTTARSFGSHKLICVRMGPSQVYLNSHPDNEEFLLMNASTTAFKPFFIVFGLCPHRQLEDKVRKNQLSQEDFLLVRMPFNDPRFSVFSLLKDTPHCEVTAPGRGNSPIFFVAEPSKLPMRYVDFQGKYSFSVCYNDRV